MWCEGCDALTWFHYVTRRQIKQIQFIPIPEFLERYLLCGSCRSRGFQLTLYESEPVEELCRWTDEVLGERLALEEWKALDAALFGRVSMLRDLGIDKKGRSLTLEKRHNAQKRAIARGDIIAFDPEATSQLFVETRSEEIPRESSRVGSANERSELEPIRWSANES